MKRKWSIWWLLLCLSTFFCFTLSASAALKLNKESVTLEIGRSYTLEAYNDGTYDASYSGRICIKDYLETDFTKYKAVISDARQ